MIVYMINKLHYHNFQSKCFDYAIILSYLLYIAFMFSLFASAPEYLHDINKILRIYISLFLIWRFNPWATIEITSLDIKIIFTAALYLLSTAVTEILFVHVTKIKHFVKNHYSINLQFLVFQLGYLIIPNLFCFISSPPSSHLGRRTVFSATTVYYNCVL